MDRVDRGTGWWLSTAPFGGQPAAGAIFGSDPATSENLPPYSWGQPHLFPGMWGAVLDF